MDYLDIDVLSQEFSQQSLMEPLQPEWMEIEDQIDRDLNSVPQDLSSMPVNMVLQSVIDFPPALPCHNPYIVNHPPKPELKRKNCECYERLYAEWSNTSYGGVYNDYRPKIVPWKKEEIVSQIPDREKELKLKEERYARVKRLIRNLKTTEEFHFAAIDDVQGKGVDVMGTMQYLTKSITDIKDQYKQEIKRDRKEINRLKSKETEEKEIIPIRTKEEILKEKSKQQVQQMTLMIKQIEDSEKTKNGCYVDSNVFKKVRQDWCGVINDLKRLKIGVPVNTYQMVENSKKAIEKLEKIEQRQKEQQLEEERPKKRRKLNSEEKKNTSSK